LACSLVLSLICFSVLAYPDETLTLVLEIVLDSRVQKVMSVWPPESCDPLKAAKYNLMAFGKQSRRKRNSGLVSWGNFPSCANESRHSLGLSENISLINDNFQSETISTLKNTGWVESTDKCKIQVYFVHVCSHKGCKLYP